MTADYWTVSPKAVFYFILCFFHVDNAQREGHEIKHCDLKAGTGLK
jgi:hypothetical protein